MTCGATGCVPTYHRDRDLRLMAVSFWWGLWEDVNVNGNERGGFGK